MNSIRTRILLFFTLIAASAIFVVFLNNKSAERIGEAAENVISRHLPMVHALDEMDVALQRQDNAVYRYVTTGDNFWRDQYEKERSNYARWFNNAFSQATEPQETDKLKDIDDLYVQYDNQTRQILLTRLRQPAKIKNALKEGDQALVQINSLINHIIGVREGMTIEHQKRIESALLRHKRTALIFFAALLAFVGILALYLWRFLYKPLRLLLDGIRNFTRGKTDVQIPSIGKDELGELQEAFNEMSREINNERRNLRSESQSDPLTGLFNMRYFRGQLAEEFSRSQRYGRPLSLLMIDVDHFKAYNDRNGHPAGDILLKEVSRIMIRNVRGTDIVARYGGEEFVILLPETPLESAARVAEKIRGTVEKHHFPFRETQTGNKVTISIGIGPYPDIHVTSDQDLIESADQALYSSKKNGRNQIRLYLKGETLPPSATLLADS